MTVKKHFNDEDGGQNEIEDLIGKLQQCLIDGKNYVVKSNHDEVIDRWLKEEDWKKDPKNAEFYLDLALAKVRAIKNGVDFDCLEYLVKETRATFLRRSDTFVLQRACA